MKYGSELAKKLEKGLTKDNSPFSIGLKSGIKEAQKEIALTKIKSKSRNYDVLKTQQSLRSKSVHKDLEKDRDMDMDMDK